MHGTMEKMARAFAEKRSQRRRAYAAFTALAILVSITTTYMLVQPANTMAVDYVCGMEEHVHTDECYEWICDGTGAASAPAEDEEASSEDGEDAPLTDGDAQEGEAGGDADAAETKPSASVSEPAAETKPDEPEPRGAAESEPATEPEAQPTESEKSDAPAEESAAAPTESESAESEPAESAPSESAETDSADEGDAVEATASAVHNDGAPSDEPSAPAEKDASDEPSASVGEPTNDEPSASASEPANDEPSAPADEPVNDEPSASAGEPANNESSASAGEPANNEPSAPAGEPANDEPSAPAEEEPEDDEDGENAADSDAETPDEETSERDAEEEKKPSGGGHGGAAKHVHNENCRRGELICGKEEHVHTKACLPQMVILPEGAEIPEGYDNEYIVYGDGYTVAVYAPDGALPDGAKLVAELLDEDSDGYAVAKDTLAAVETQEIEVYLGGVMSREALDEAAASAAPEETPAEDENDAESAESVDKEENGETIDEEESAEPTEEEPADSEPAAGADSEEEPIIVTVDAVHNDAAPSEAKPGEESAEEPGEEPAEESTETAQTEDEAFAYDGFIALDIHFELDGEEIEPEVPVFVYIDVKGLLPENVDPDSVQVQHHVELLCDAPAMMALTGETATAESTTPETETVVELVADGTDETGVLETEEGTDGVHVTTFFAVESFSTYTVTWTNKSTAGKYVAYMGNELLDLLRNNKTIHNVTVANSCAADDTVRLTATANDPYVFTEIDESVKATTDTLGYILVGFRAYQIANEGNDWMAVFGADKADTKYANTTAQSGWANEARSASVTYKNVLKIENAAESSDDDYYYAIFDLKSAYDKIDGVNKNLNYVRLDFAQLTVNGNYIDLDVLALCSSEKVAEMLAKQRGTVGDDSYIETVAGNGIEFKLFNYDDKRINKTEDGTAWRQIADYFTFRDSSGNRRTDIASDVRPSMLQDDAVKYDIPGNNYRNPNVDVDGYTQNHAKVESTLVDGYPVLDLTNDTEGAKLSQAERSLQYLFSEGDYAVTAYEPDNTILLYDEESKTYYYDSADNAVDYEDGRFYLRNYAERNASTSGYQQFDGSYYGDFLPFNHTGGVEVGATGDVPYHLEVGDVDYWFGMTMEFRFVQTNGGQLADEDGDAEDMVFKFSGDDDVWVFIDDVLVLDLGGTHGTVDGEINFATGEVKRYLSWNNGKETDSATSFPTTLAECFAAAGKSDQINSDGRFDDWTTHTLKFFYMERGGSVANCKMEFNLTTMESNTLNVSKRVTGGELLGDDSDYTFQVLHNDADKTPLANAAYTVNGAEKTTDATGKFTLKANEMASFSITKDEKELIVRELISTADASKYGAVTISSNGSSKTLNDGVAIGNYLAFDSEPVSINNDSAIVFAFTNTINPGKLEINKSVLVNGSAENGQVFDFTLKCTNGTIDWSKVAGVIYDEETGTAGVRVTAGTPVTLAGLPAGAALEITEIGYDGYAPSWSLTGGDESFTGGATGQVTLTAGTTATIYFRNTTGAALPSTGGTGTELFTGLGITLMLGAGTLLILKRRRGEGPAAA